MRKRTYSRVTSYKTLNNYIKIDEVKDATESSILKYGLLPLNVLYPGMIKFDSDNQKIVLSSDINESYYEQDDIVVNNDEIRYYQNTGFRVSQSDVNSKSYITGGWKDMDHIEGENSHATSVVVMTPLAIDFPENVWTSAIPGFIDVPLISFYDYSYNYGEIKNQRLLDYIQAFPNCINDLYDELKVLFTTMLLAANAMCYDEFLNSDLHNASLSNLTHAVYNLCKKLYAKDANNSGKQIGFPTPNQITTFNVDGYECTTDYRVSLLEFLSFITPAMKLIGFAYNGRGVTIDFTAYNVRHWLATGICGSYGHAGTQNLGIRQMTANVIQYGAPKVANQAHLWPGVYVIANFNILTSPDVKLFKKCIKLLGTYNGNYIFRNYSDNVISIINTAGNVSVALDPSDELFIGAIKHPKFEETRNLTPLILADALPSNSNTAKANAIATATNNVTNGFNHKGRIVKLDDLNDDFLSVGEIVLETNNHFINESDPDGGATVLAVDRFTSQACEIKPVRNDEGHITSMSARSLNGSYSLAIFSRDLSPEEILLSNTTTSALKFSYNGLNNPLTQFVNNDFNVLVTTITNNEQDYTAQVKYVSSKASEITHTVIVDANIGAFNSNNNSFHDYIQTADFVNWIQDDGGVWAAWSVTNAENSSVATFFCDYNDNYYAISGDHVNDSLQQLRHQGLVSSVDADDSIRSWVGDFSSFSHITYSRLYINFRKGAINSFGGNDEPWACYYDLEEDDGDYEAVGDIGCYCLTVPGYNGFYSRQDYRTYMGHDPEEGSYCWLDLLDSYVMNWSAWDTSPDYATYTESATEVVYNVAVMAQVPVSVPSVGFNNLILQYDTESHTITAAIGLKPSAQYLNNDIIGAINTYGLALSNKQIEWQRLPIAYEIEWSDTPYSISVDTNVNGMFNMLSLGAKCLSVLLNRTNLISPLADAISPDLDKISPTLLAESQQFLQTTLKDAIALQVANLENFLSDPEVIRNSDELTPMTEYYYCRQEVTADPDVFNFIVSNFVVTEVREDGTVVVSSAAGVTTLDELDPIADAFVPANALRFGTDSIIVSPCWVPGATSSDQGHLSYYSITDFTQLQSDVLVGDNYMPYYKAIILERILDYDSKDAQLHKGNENKTAKSRTSMLGDLTTGISASFNDLSEVYANYCEAAFTLQFTEAIDRLVDAGVQDSISDVNTYLDGIGDGMLANLKSKMGNISGVAHKTAAGTLTLFNKCSNKIKVALSSAKNTVSTTYAKLGSLKANVSYKVQALSENIQNASRNAVTAFQSWLGLGASEISTGWSDDSAISNRSNLDLAFDISMPDMSGVLGVCKTLGALVDKGVNWVCDKVDKFMSETFVDGLSYSINTSGYETLDIPQYRERYSEEDFLDKYPFMGGYFLAYINATDMQEATMTIQCNSVLLFFQRVYGEGFIRVYGNTIFDLGSDDYTDDANDFTFLEQMLTTNNRARSEYNTFVARYNYIRNIAISYFSNTNIDMPIIATVSLANMDDIYSKVFSGAYVEQAKQVTKRMRFCGWLSIGLGALLCCTGYGAAAGAALIGVGVAANVAADVTDLASGTTNINKILEKARGDSTFANKEITSAELRDVWMDMPAAIFGNYLMVADLAFNGGYVHAGMGRLLNDGSYIPMTIYAGTPSFKYHIVTDKERAQKTRLNLTILTAAVVTAVVGTVMLGRKISAKRRMYDNATKQWSEPSAEDQCFDKVITVGDDGKMTVTEQLKPGLTEKDYKKAQAKYNKHMRKYQKKYDKAAAMLDGDSGASSEVDLTEVEDSLSSANEYLQSTINRIG